MSERHTTGTRVLAGREGKGLTLRRAARRLGVSPRTLRGWERGREDIPFAVRKAMVALYGMDPEQLVPERRVTAFTDLAAGTISIGSVTFAVEDADDDTLRAFLTAVRAERGVATGAGLRLRASDAEVLAGLLGGTPESIVGNLQRLLGVDEGEAVELGRWMFRRTAVAGALVVGLVAGVAGTGAFSSHPPVAGAGEVGAGAPANPSWAVIGDAAVLERGGVQHNR